MAVLGASGDAAIKTGDNAGLRKDTNTTFSTTTTRRRSSSSSRRSKTDEERKLPLIERPLEILSKGEKEILARRIEAEAKAGSRQELTNTQKQLIESDQQLQKTLNQIQKEKFEQATKDKEIEVKVERTTTERGTQDIKRYFDVKTGKLIAEKTDTRLNIVSGAYDPRKSREEYFETIPRKEANVNVEQQRAVLNQIDFYGGALEPNINVDLNKVVEQSKDFSLTQIDYFKETQNIRKETERVKSSPFSVLPFAGSFFAGEAEQAARKPNQSPFVGTYTFAITGGGQGTTLRYDNVLSDSIKAQDELNAEITRTRQKKGIRLALETPALFYLVGTKATILARKPFFQTSLGKGLGFGFSSAVINKELETIKSGFVEAQTFEDYVFAVEDLAVSYSRFAAVYAGSQYQRQVLDFKIKTLTYQYKPTRSVLVRTKDGAVISGQTQLKSKPYDVYAGIEKQKLSLSRIDPSIQKKLATSKFRLASVQDPTTKAFFGVDKPTTDTKLYEFTFKEVTTANKQYQIPRSFSPKRTTLFNKKGQLISRQTSQLETTYRSDLYETSSLNLDYSTPKGTDSIGNIGYKPQKLPLFPIPTIKSDQTQKNIIRTENIKTPNFQTSTNFNFDNTFKSDFEIKKATSSDYKFLPVNIQKSEKRPQTATTTPQITFQEPQLTPEIETLNIPRTQPPITTLTTQQTPDIPPFPNFKPLFIPFSGKKQVPKFDLGFDVFIRRQGKFKKQNINPLTKSQALDLGIKRVDTTAAATFKLSRSQDKALKNYDYGGFDKFKLDKQFRTKKEDDDTLFIEKRKFRISTAGELNEITFKRRF